MESTGNRRTNVCSNYPGHMTKVVAMPKYVETLKICSRAAGPIALKLGMWHQLTEYYQVSSNDDRRLTLTYFMAMSNLVP